MAAYVPTTGRGFQISLGRLARSATHIYWPAAVAAIALVSTLGVLVNGHRSAPAIVVLPASPSQSGDAELALRGAYVERRSDFVTLTGEVRNLTNHALSHV